MKLFILRKITLVLIVLSLSPAVAIAQSDFWISGRVKESLGKNDLTQAVVYMLDSEGNPVDTCRCDIATNYINGENVKVSYFGFFVPRCDSTYVMEVRCPKYTTKTITHNVSNVGKRERYRDIPTVFLERAPHRLDEVTVTATKIKFYNRGDTIVYNADAFELAEGSMLDALIEQLPGVELKEGGQILVNGEPVESLLLNGREFFNNNNELMLENIGAYTVKNIEVYKGYTREEKWSKRDFGEKHLTMDVKLKREYNTGLTANAQAGYGTEDRYTARLFGLWYNNSLRLTALGNFNNLNDTRKPGQKDSWSPDAMPSGTRKYQLGAIDYNYMNAEETRRFNGDITYTSTINDNRDVRYQTNFFNSGNTYENAFSKSYNRSIRLSSYHYGTWRGERWMPTYCFKGIYQSKDNDSESLSGAFSEEQTEMTMQALEAIYSSTDDALLKSILNRASTRSDGRSHSTELQFFPGIYYFVPSTSDNIQNEFGVRYRWSKEDIWRDYTINYGDNPVPGDLRRQYIDNSPNTFLRIQNNLSYLYRLNRVSLKLNYEYHFDREIKDSYQYALERLEDAGIFGQLPSGWMSTLDPQNSYKSHTFENYHTISPSVQYYLFGERYHFLVIVSPDFTLRHSHMNYERAGHFYPLRKSFFFTTFSGWSGHFNLGLETYKDNERHYSTRHDFTVDFNMKPDVPRLTDLIDITDDSNPLNIYMGNPDLKIGYQYSPQFRYLFSHNRKHSIMNDFSVQFEYMKDALTRGYTYNTTTGVRYNRMYNVDGNRAVSLSNNFTIQFGSKNQFTLQSATNAGFYRSADMVGINSDEPSLSIVNNRNVSQGLTFGWQIGKQSLRLVGNYSNRYSYSSREDFRTISADRFTYGIIANFKLPYNIGFNTDFNVYTRRGYGVKELDTNDAIWNMRLTWTPKKASCWTFMIDGFDMLHQLSNVNYAVTATGRTISYSNALPRYMLFSVQYRFQRQPKKH